jgi:hypothetical protein
LLSRPSPTVKSKLAPRAKQENVFEEIIAGKLAKRRSVARRLDPARATWFRDITAFVARRMRSRDADIYVELGLLAKADAPAMCLRNIHGSSPTNGFHYIELPEH